MIVTVREQGANTGGQLYISFIKWLVSTTFILSIVTQIQTEFWYDIKSVFFIGTKFQGYRMRSCSLVAESKYASLQRTNKESANVFSFHLHVRAPPTSVPRWVDERNFNLWHSSWKISVWKFVGPHASYNNCNADIILVWRWRAEGHPYHILAKLPCTNAFNVANQSMGLLHGVLWQ